MRQTLIRLAFQRDYLSAALFAGLLVTVTTIVARCDEPTTHSVAELAVLPSAVEVPSDNPTTTRKVELGKQLFFDPRLSGDNRMSCATCHLPDKAFGDGLPVGIGRDGKKLARNTQTLINVAFYSSYFWDGRAKSLEEQALIPLQSPDEMNQDPELLVRELAAVPEYIDQFQEVFGRPIHAEDITRALAAFQRTMIAGQSPFDRYLAGDKQALSKKAREGLRLFQGDAGCIRCHNGPLLSDGKFYRIGIGNDQGHGLVTGRNDDRYKFRTPSLRNVAETGPYFHNGSRESLYDVVEYYYRNAPSQGPDGLELDIQPLLGQSFSDIESLAEFLKSLSGKMPDVRPPPLP
jgi:cytochrome c peroxidase